LVLLHVSDRVCELAGGRLHSMALDDQNSDDELMRAYAMGDARAFELLYRRHAGALYRLVSRLVGSSAGGHADEVFQDTWSRVIGARERWAPQGASFRTWLFTIAQRRAIDVLRRSGREAHLDDDDEPWSPGGSAWQDWPAPAADPADLAFWHAAGERLLRCLDELPVAQKAVFLMHHEDGLAIDEAARSLRIGFETAKSRLRYAMTKLRACMGAYLPAGSTTEAA